MGRNRLQQVLNNKLGSESINLSKYSKDTETKKKALLNGRSMDIGMAAAENLTWLSSPIQEYTDEELKNLNNFTWETCYRMSDANLCHYFQTINRKYYTMKQRGLLGEQEAEADEIIGALRERMEIMANPFYDLLDPSSLDKVHSSTIEEILNEPDIYEAEESVLYEEENANETYLPHYLIHIAEKNKFDEQIQHREVTNMLQTGIDSAIESIADLNEAQDMSAEEINTQTTDSYRLIIGYTMIMKQVNEKHIAHDLDKMQSVCSEKNCREITKNIPDYVIEEFRREIGDAALLKQLQQKVPMDQNPLLQQFSQMDERAQASKERKWFDEMALELSAGGIDIFNPLTAAMIQIRQDTTEDEILNVPDFSTSIAGKKMALDRALATQKFALVNMDGSGNYKNPYDPDTSQENQIQWLAKNSITPANISPEQISYLYKMAQENRLILKSTHPDSDKYQRNVYLKVGKNGEAVMTAPMGKLLKKEAREQKLYEQNGFTREEFENVSKLDANYGSLEEGIRGLYYGTCSMYSMEIQTQQALRNEEEVRRLTEEYTKFKDTYSVLLAQREICADCVRHPHWYSNEKSIDEHTRYYAVGKTLPDERSEADLNMILDNPVADRSLIYIEEDLLKMTGCKDLPEMMRSGLIRHSDGKAIEAENDYEFIKTVYRSCLGGDRRLMVGDKKYVYDPSGLGFDADTAERSQRVWFDSLRKTMTEMGYTTPMSMMMLRVQGEGDPEELVDLPTTYEGGIRGLQLLDNCSHPALMPTDGKGELLTPQQPSEHPAAWAFRAMPKSWDDVKPEQISYLYNMAKNNRLYLQSDDQSMARYNQNRFISITPNDEVSISKSMDVLAEELAANPNAQTIGGYDIKTFKDMLERDNRLSSIEAGFEQLTSSLESFHMDELERDANAHPEKKEYFNTVKAQYFAIRNARLGCREACADARRHPYWYKTQGSAEKMTNLFITSKKDPALRTPEEQERLHSTPIAAKSFEEIENALLKASNQKTLEGVMAGSRVRFAPNTAPVKTGDTLEFMSDITRRMIKGEEVYVGGTPYKYAAGYGFTKGINKAGYVSELSFLASRLTKTEGNWTDNSDEYAPFADALKALPGQVNALREDTDMNFDKLRSMVQPAAEAANNYFRTHRNISLSSRQMERIKVMNRFLDLVGDIEKKNVNPGTDLNYRIAEKLFTAGCIQMKRGDLLLNSEFRTNCIKQTLNDPAFREKLQGCDETAKLNILKTSGKNAIKLFSGRTDAVQEQINKEKTQNNPNLG